MFLVAQPYLVHSKRDCHFLPRRDPVVMFGVAGAAVGALLRAADAYFAMPCHAMPSAATASERRADHEDSPPRHVHVIPYLSLIHI